MNQIPLKETEKGLLIQVRVLPRSSRCELSGIQNGALKIKITSPPLEGKANEECVRFLADKLRIRKSQIEIVAGHKARNKTVMISGLKRKELESLIASSPSPLPSRERA